MRTKYTARVRRGFLFALRSLQEDTDYELLDRKAPWFRRLGKSQQKDLDSALRYMQEGAAKEDLARTD